MAKRLNKYIENDRLWCFEFFGGNPVNVVTFKLEDAIRILRKDGDNRAIKSAVKLDITALYETAS